MEPNRLDQLDQEIARLHIKGGNPEPERRLVVAGILATLAGLALLVFAVIGTRAAQTVEKQNDYLVLGPLGLSLSVVGSVVWVRNSLSRYLRFWLVRLIYETRANSDRVAEAVRSQPSNEESLPS